MHYAKGIGQPRMGPSFVMEHKANSMLASTSKPTCVVQYGYNEYMVHHYPYMAKVAEIRKPKSYLEAAHDTNWKKQLWRKRCTH